MKKFFSIIGFVTLISLGFIYTERITNVLLDNDELMMTINEVSSDYKIDPIDGVVADNTFIPGINGLEVNNKKSYKSMKKYGIFNSDLLEFIQIKPKNKLKNNYDKYIISGNTNKNMVSLIFIVNGNDNIKNIINILKTKKIKANFFVDGYWFEDNNDEVTDLINSGHIVGNLSYNLDYNDGAFVWMDTIIKRIGKQKKGYCYAEVENQENLNICSMNKNYTIKPSIVVKENYLNNIKNYIVSGSIISLAVTSSLEEELPVIINYIKSKGYEITNLNVLLSEER